jgi:hypothetical protein
LFLADKNTIISLMESLKFERVMINFCIVFNVPGVGLGKTLGLVLGVTPGVALGKLAGKTLGVGGNVELLLPLG